MSGYQYCGPEKYVNKLFKLFDPSINKFNSARRAHIIVILTKAIVQDVPSTDKELSAKTLVTCERARYQLERKIDIVGNK